MELSVSEETQPEPETQKESPAQPRRRLRLAAAIAGGVLLLILAGALIAPSLVDWTRYKGRIAEIASEATGRAVTIAGPVSFTLLPAPALRAEEVSVANIEDGDAEAMARLATLDVVVALFPLIKGEIDVRRLALGEPEIALERLADGRVNWQFPALQGEPDAREASVSVEQFEIRDGRLRYSDLGSGETMSLEAVDAEISAGSLSGPFQLTASAESAGVPLRLRFRSERFAPQARVGIYGEIEVDEARGEYSGWLRPQEDEGMPESEGDLTLEGDDLSSALSALRRIASREDGDLSSLEKAFAIEGRIATGERLQISGLRVQFADTRLTGEGELDLASGPTGEIALMAERIDLDALLSSGKTGEAAFNPPAAETFAVDGPLLPESWAIAATLDVAALRYRDRVIDSAEFALRSEAGAVLIEAANARLPGASQFDFTGRLEAAEALPRLTGQLRVESEGLASVFNWLDLRPPGGLARLTSGGLDTALEVNPARLALSDLTLRLDSTTAKGRLALERSAETMRLDTDLAIDRIDLDRYLPAANADADPMDLQTALAAIEDSLLRLSGLTGRIALDLDRLQFADTPIRGLQLRAALGDRRVIVEEARVADVLAASGFVSGRLQLGEEGLRGDTLLRAEIPNPEAVAGWLESSLPVDADALAPVSLEGTLSGGRERLELELTSTLAGGRATLEGHIERPAADSPGPMALTLGLTHTSHRALAERLGLEAMSRGAALPFELTADIEGDMEALALTLDSRALGGRAGFKGTLHPRTEPLDMEGDIDLAHPDLRKLVRQIHPDYSPAKPDLGPLELQTRLKGSLAAPRLEDIRAQLGPTQLSGRMNLDLAAKERRRIDATFKADALPVSDFLPAPQTGPEKAKIAPTHRWSSAPFDLSGLDGWTGQVRLDAESFTFAPYRLTDMSVEAALEGDSMRLSQLQGRLFGGTLDVTGTLDLAGESRELTTAIRLDDASVEDALAAATRLRPAEGRLVLEGQFRARGRSQLALVSSLSGAGEIVVRDGLLHGFDLPALMRGLDRAGSREGIGQRIRSALAGGSTPLEVLRAKLQVSDGILSAEPVTASLAGGQLSAQARLDLAGWTMSASGHTTLADRPKAPPIALEIGGNIAAPRVALQAPGLAQWLTRRLAAEALQRLRLPGPRGPVDAGLPEVVGPPPEARPPEDPAPAPPTAEKDGPGQ